MNSETLKEIETNVRQAAGTIRTNPNRAEQYLMNVLQIFQNNDTAPKTLTPDHITTIEDLNSGDVIKLNSVISIKIIGVVNDYVIHNEINRNEEEISSVRVLTFDSFKALLKRIQTGTKSETYRKR